VISRHTHSGLLWIDLESPNRDEVKSIAQEFGLDRFVAEELLIPSLRPRAEFHGTYCYVILHFPAMKHSRKSREQEVDFVIGKDFIITTHYETVDPLHKFSKVFDMNAVLPDRPLGENAGYIFFSMLKVLYKGIDHEVDMVRRDCTAIEEHIFAGEEINMVAAISRSARDLLNMRQIVEPHRDVLHALETDGPAFFGPDFAPYLRAMSNEYYRVHNHIMRQTESLHELRETNNSMLTTKQNETIKVLTIMAFVTFPLSLIVAIFSMDAKHTPIVGTEYDFWVILGIMGCAALIMLAYFKHKNWL